MKKVIILLCALSVQTVLFAQEYYPEGTKWTEIRLDTLKYDSWYSKVGDEWVPNFETVEYYVKGVYLTAYSEDSTKYELKCVYTNSAEWSDSLTLIIIETELGILATTRIFNKGELRGLHSPGTAYNWGDWYVGKQFWGQTIEGAETLSIPEVGHFCLGTVKEIKETYFGGSKPLLYEDLDRGGRIINGIGVTEWNNNQCLFGPIMEKKGGNKSPQYHSMLVHFERNGEVLYDIWPEPGNENSIRNITPKPTPGPSLVSGAVYDLQGRKLSDKPTRGIYIEGGKKRVKNQ